MRLAQAFRIELDYQRHRSKLKQIKSTDSRKQVSKSIAKNLDIINCYNRKKTISIHHNDFQRERQICNTNQHLYSRLTKTYNKDPSNKIIRCITTQSILSRNRSNSQNSVRSSGESRIIQENQKLAKKINMTKSSYKKFRPRKHVFGASQRDILKQEKLQEHLVPKKLPKVGKRYWNSNLNSSSYRK